MTTKRIVADLDAKILTRYDASTRTLRTVGHNVDLAQVLTGKHLEIRSSCSCGDDCHVARSFAQLYAEGIKTGLRSAGLLEEDV